MKHQKILFVTGKLAEPALRKVVSQIQAECSFEYEVQVLPITVAALMTPQWIQKHIRVSPEIDRVILPGYCHGDFSSLNNLTKADIEIGPKDLRKLPQFFGQQIQPENYGEHDIEIIAEINHAPRKSFEEIIAIAKHYAACGADVIDVGCEVDSVWTKVTDCVKAIKDLGLRVSIDSLIPDEISAAVKAGAELVLSVNSSNIAAAADWGTEVVLIPDQPDQWQDMVANIELLESQNVAFRVDPIVEPIGFGFAASLKRYMDFREQWPEVPMMMGIGNLTELTETDSAGINLMLMCICQELEVRSVLTTQVIPWAQSSARECDIARQLSYYSIQNRQLPKHVDSRLVTLRDSSVSRYGKQTINELAKRIKDHNYRILAEDGMIHLMGSGQHWQAKDPFVVFDQLAETNPKNLDASHAFYLGYEMCKAMTAMNLGKEYVQDEALDWGFLTVSEKNRHRISKRKSKTKSQTEADTGDEK